MCRRDIPVEFLDHPELVYKIQDAGPTTDDGYQWFYEGRNGKLCCRRPAYAIPIPFRVTSSDGKIFFDFFEVSLVILKLANLKKYTHKTHATQTQTFIAIIRWLVAIRCTIIVRNRRRLSAATTSRRFGVNPLRLSVLHQFQWFDPIQTVTTDE